MLFAFCWLKMEEKKDRHYRKTLTLREILLMAIPSICNSISGSLYYVLQRMLNDELTIHSFSSFQIVTVAIISYFLLHRSLTMTHWMALLLLCTSVMSIELRSCPRCHTTDYPFLPSVLGIISASALGVSSVVTEWILKEHRDIHMPQQTLWVYFWSVVIAFMRMCFFGSPRLTQQLTFTNWNGYAVCLVISEVIRGLSTSYILKKTDSLTSSFVYCFSLIVAALILSSVTNEVIPYPSC